ncbi:MAG: hypothetical protein U1E21_24010, partial [Reyranellaceae bacterium]
TGSVARGVEDELRALGTPVARFGVVADGTTDDTDAWQAALDSGEPLLLPDRASKLSALLEVAEPNTRIYGRHRRQSRLVSSYQFIFKIREGADDFQIFDVGLESTKSASAMQYYGLIHVNNESVDGIHVERCYFTAPNCNTNGIGLYADKADGTNLIRNIKILNNRFKSMGVGGICLQNHLHEMPAWRIRNFEIAGNLFENIGTVDPDYGMAATLTGRVADGVVAFNIIDDPLGIGLEMAGGNYNVHFLYNGFRNVTRRGYGSATFPISCSSSTTPRIPHYSCSIVGNYSEAGATVEGGLFFGDMKGAVISKNSFDLKDSVTIRDCEDLSGESNKWRCQGAKGLVLEGTSGAACKRNRLRDTQVDMSSRSSAATAVVSYEGTSGSCDGNVLDGGLLTRPSGGGAWVTNNDSTNSRNVVERMSTADAVYAERLQTVTMTDADLLVDLISAQYKTLRILGTLTATRALRLPREGTWTIYNNTTGGQTLSVAPSGGTGVNVANGAKKVIITRTGDAGDYTPA